MSVQGIAFGSVFCNEVLHLDYTQGKGLERSDVILWPSVTCSAINDRNVITKDNTRIGATQIARYYGVPVIQANYISYASQEQNTQEDARGRMLGGSVACDAAGQILDQASWAKEDMRSFEISRVDGAVIVTPVDDGHMT